MKYLYQFLIIALITFISELLNYMIPLTIPASIYGLVIMLVLLKSGVLKLKYIKDVGGFLLDTMPIMFVPIGVEIITIYSAMTDFIFPATVITIVTTIIVMVVTGLVSQKIIRRDKEDI
ncbi:CidA/LrgA family protein [Anaerofustis stercorihominis]|uniref:LrgA family protein n=1 Tax=Anaerofustis stercorihominis DSM 17244 TaxID=445971 RepID=B1C7F7_9FIRM|nr:CidA/LrgA family protein [Anaerofustis stercorihominis]EDS72944.1 LrgA family protein [Anaerofustis stercorihominis DSM 17244]